MKKSILSVILIISAVFCAFGQNSDTIDLVLLLDTSSAMGSSYEKVNDYITGAFLSEFLRVGDTFHLISFSSSPRLDIARRISAKGDIETIVGRMLIQYPVETGNDARAAVNYVEAYISTLPPRPKKIVMVSAAGPETSSIINAAKQRLSSKNASFDFISVTEAVPGNPNLANPPGSGRSSPRQSSSQQSAPSGTIPAAGTGTTKPSSGSASPASAQGASSAQATQGTSTQGASQTGTQAAAQGTSTQGTTGGASSGAQSPTQGTTGGASSGVQSTQGTGTSQTGAQSTTPASSSDTKSSGSSAQGVSSSDGKQASGKDSDSQKQNNAAKGSTTAGISDSSVQKDSRSINPTLLLIIGIIAALLLLILLIVFVSRRLGSSPNRVMASVSASGGKEEKFSNHSSDLASYAARQSKQRVTPYQGRPVKQYAGTPTAINPSGPLLLNLFVEDQNTSIGKRNIHSLKSGYSLTVGGGNSDDFHIFLVPMPQHLGDIRRNGSQLTFVPRKPKYFPDLGSNEVRDCLNKRIRVVSDKNYEMWFSFAAYEDPLEALNRVLHSIKVPG